LALQTVQVRLDPINVIVSSARIRIAQEQVEIFEIILDSWENCTFFASWLGWLVGLTFAAGRSLKMKTIPKFQPAD